MMEMSTEKENELSDQNKVVFLFRFIHELNKLKHRAEDEDPNASATLLSVRKPEFQKCPEAAPNFRDWLNPGWEELSSDRFCKRDNRAAA